MTSAITMAGCSSCARDWRHCHGTWIAHRTGGECTNDQPCREPAEAHDTVVDCQAVDSSCCGE
jgi:hypothetical protein